jgi:hypothetical protein
VTDEEYKAEYDKAAAELDATAQATTARGPDGRFAKAQPEETPAPTPEAKPEPAPEQAKEPEKQPEDPLAEFKARLERAEKMAKDNQAWATRVAQENAEIKREQERREREAKKPAILDANPELADAIRYVAADPVPQQPDPRTAWSQAVDKAHPGIFQLPDDDELVKAVAARAQKEPEAWNDPFVAARMITEEKLAVAERQLGKRFAAEAARQAQKSAMSVPGAGAGSGVNVAPVDAQLAEVQRIKNLSDREFQAEVRRVKGY